MDKIDRF